MYYLKKLKLSQFKKDIEILNIYKFFQNTLKFCMLLLKNLNIIISVIFEANKYKIWNLNLSKAHT